MKKSVKGCEQRRKGNRWTTVGNCRTTKCTYRVGGADKMDNERRNRGVVIMLCLMGVDLREFSEIKGTISV